MSETLNLTLKVWRQPTPAAAGEFKTYKVYEISTDMSFLEMLDVLNEDLVAKGEEPVAFDNDCREGICGTCGLMINGQAHGPQRGTTTRPPPLRTLRGGRGNLVEPVR